jgi:hypothetical protein
VFEDLRVKEEAVDPLLPEVRREVKALGNVTTALRDAQAALRGEAVDVARLGHACAALQVAKVQEGLIAGLLPGLQEELGQAERALAYTFGEDLRDAFAAQGVTLGGRPPHFEIGRFALDADFVARSASLSYGKTLVVRKVALSVEAVQKAYGREAELIMGRNEDAARWIEQFYAAWEAARHRRDSADQRANIVDCYYELVLLRQSKSFRSAPSKHSFVDYSRAQFAHDFFEVAHRQRPTYNGLRLFAHGATKSQAQSSERSIWIVEGDSPHDGRYIADVVFTRDG